MCRMMMPMSSDKPVEAGLSLKAAPSPGKENSNAGGNYFVSTKPAIFLKAPCAWALEDPYFFYNNPSIPAPGLVPKF